MLHVFHNSESGVTEVRVKDREVDVSPMEDLLPWTHVCQLHLGTVQWILHDDEIMPTFPVEVNGDLL